MPRTSPEERAAAFWRIGNKAPAAPSTLSAPARKIWRRVVGSKPVDWFDPGQFDLLADYCETAARLSGLWGRLREVEAGTVQARLLTSEQRRLSVGLATSARQLRLTVQHSIKPQTSKREERGSAHPWLGGRKQG